MIWFHWPASRFYLPRDGFSTLQEEFTTQEGSTTLQEELTILIKDSLPCKRSLSLSGNVHYPAGKDFHPQNGFAVSQQELTTLRNGSLPCRRSLPPSGRVHYFAGGVYRPWEGFATLQVFTTLRKDSLRCSLPVGEDFTFCRSLPLLGKVHYPCKRSLPLSERLYHPAGRIYHPYEWFTALQELTSLG
jgi:hypothetical protein